MTPSTELTRAIRKALSADRACPPRAGGRPGSRALDPADPTDPTVPPPDPDWAIREIVDGAMFETSHS